MWTACTKVASFPKGCPLKIRYRFQLISLSLLDFALAVFVGFGEGDNDEGNFVELPAGRHSWRFSFSIPADAPTTYRDKDTSVTYKLTAVLDSLMVETPDCRLRLNHEIVRSKMLGLGDHLSKRNLNR